MKREAPAIESAAARIETDLGKIRNNASQDSRWVTDKLEDIKKHMAGLRFGWRVFLAPWIVFVFILGMIFARRGSIVSRLLGPCGEPASRFPVPALPAPCRWHNRLRRRSDGRDGLRSPVLRRCGVVLRARRVLREERPGAPPGELLARRCGEGVGLAGTALSSPTSSRTCSTPRSSRLPTTRTPTACQSASCSSVTLRLSGCMFSICSAREAHGYGVQGCIARAWSERRGVSGAGRYLASFAWRYNRRYQLQTMIPRFVHSAARTEPMELWPEVGDGVKG